MEVIEIDPEVDGWNGSWNKLFSKIKKQLPLETRTEKYAAIVTTIMTFDSGNLRTKIGADEFLYVTWAPAKQNQFPKAVVWYALKHEGDVK